MRFFRFLSFGCFFLSSYIHAQDLPVSTRVSVKKNNINIQAYIQPFDRKEIKVNSDYEYYFYYHNNIQRLRGDYMGDLLNGNYQELNNDHKMIRSGKFEQGLKCGDWKEWDEFGELRSLSQFKFGVLHGKVIDYSQNGRKADVEIYKKGKSTGKRYSVEDGKKVKTEQVDKKKKVVKEKKKKENKKPVDKKIKKSKKPNKSKD